MFGHICGCSTIFVDILLNLWTLCQICRCFNLNLWMITVSSNNMVNSIQPSRSRKYKSIKNLPLLGHFKIGNVFILVCVVFQQLMKYAKSNNGRGDLLNCQNFINARVACECMFECVYVCVKLLVGRQKSTIIGSDSDKNEFSLLENEMELLADESLMQTQIETS